MGSIVEVRLQGRDCWLPCRTEFFGPFIPDTGHVVCLEGIDGFEHWPCFVRVLNRTFVDSDEGWVLAIVVEPISPAKRGPIPNTLGKRVLVHRFGRMFEAKVEEAWALTAEELAAGGYELFPLGTQTVPSDSVVNSEGRPPERGEAAYHNVSMGIEADLKRDGMDAFTSVPMEFEIPVPDACLIKNRRREEALRYRDEVMDWITDDRELFVFAYVMGVVAGRGEPARLQDATQVVVAS